jgi:type VII secretion-associated serine protease mycosin
VKPLPGAAAMLAIAVAVAIPVPSIADEVRDRQWHLGFLDISRAHAISIGSGTTVAVIDTGVDPHPDLSSNLLNGAAFDPRTTGNGKRDQVGHGTGMAGLIAAHGHGSNDGALGIAPGAKLLPVIDNMTGDQGDSRYTAQAIDWSVAHGADVINISSHGAPSPELRAAVSSAIANDVVVVAGVGNRPSQNTIGFPAFYPGVVAVGAIDRNGKLASLSVTGEGVTLSAPGVDIMTTRPRRQYAAGSGTSAATAIVSGAAALVRSRFPQLAAADVVRRLTATATDKGPPGRDDQYGYGVLNLVAALTADLPPPAETTPPAAAPAPEPPRQGSGRTAVVAFLAVGAVIAAFALHVRARRRRARGGPVA